MLLARSQLTWLDDTGNLERDNNKNIWWEIIRGCWTNNWKKRIIRFKDPLHFQKTPSRLVRNDSFPSLVWQARGCKTHGRLFFLGLNLPLLWPVQVAISWPSLVVITHWSSVLFFPITVRYVPISGLLFLCNSLQSHRNFWPGPSESNPLVQLTWHCLRQLFLLLPPYHEYLGSIQATTRRTNMVLEIVIAISIMNRKFSLALSYLKSLVIFITSTLRTCYHELGV